MTFAPGIGAKPRGRIRFGFVRSLLLLFVFTIAGTVASSELSPAETGGPIEGWKLDGKRPDFSIRDINKKTVRLDDFRGRRLLVVFFATCCCLNCPDEMTALGRFERKIRGSGLSILGVSIDSVTTEVVKQYLKTWGVEFQVIHDEEGDLFRAFRLEGIPTTFFLGPDGRLEGRTKGMELTRWNDPRVRRLLESWRKEKGLPFAPIPPEEAEDPDDDDEEPDV